MAQLAYAKDAFIAGLIQNNAVVVPELRGGVTAGRAAFEDTSACYPLYEEPIHVVEYIANVDLQYSTALRVSRDASIATGGYYDPRNCGASKPRTSLAIIVPYRERQENLPAFLGYMHPFLQRQGVEYKFYLISQVGVKSESKKEKQGKRFYLFSRKSTAKLSTAALSSMSAI